MHPKFRLRTREIPAESLVIQSVLTRCMGKMQRWAEICAAQAKLGYNALHVLPMQKYGISNSMYSIRDQHSLDDCYVDDPRTTEEERVDLLEKTIGEVREKTDLLCFVDIVLNHTANNSDWLLDHPDAAYNLHNCPYLRVAYHFDVYLRQFSEDYAQGRIAECPRAPYISTDDDVRAVLKALGDRVKGLPLDQYFVYDKNKVRAKLTEFLSKGPYTGLDELKASRVNIMDYIIKHSYGYGEKQHGVDVSAMNTGNIG